MSQKIFAPSARFLVQKFFRAFGAIVEFKNFRVFGAIFSSDILHYTTCYWSQQCRAAENFWEIVIHKSEIPLKISTFDVEFPMKSCYFDVNSNEKFLRKLCNKNIHEKLHIQENYTLKITHAGENYTCRKSRSRFK